MQLYVYMPPVDDFGNLQIGDDRIGYVDVTVEITAIIVDMGSEDFEKMHQGNICCYMVKWY